MRYEEVSNLLYVLQRQLENGELTALVAVAFHRHEDGEVDMVPIVAGDVELPPIVCACELLKRNVLDKITENAPTDEQAEQVSALRASVKTGIVT
jgi:hypothetical protein